MAATIGNFVKVSSSRNPHQILATLVLLSLRSFTPYDENFAVAFDVEVIKHLQASWLRGFPRGYLKTWGVPLEI